VYIRSSEVQVEGWRDADPVSIHKDAPGPVPHKELVTSGVDLNSSPERPSQTLDDGDEPLRRSKGTSGRPEGTYNASC